MILLRTKNYIKDAYIKDAVLINIDKEDTTLTCRELEGKLYCPETGE